MGPNAEGCKEKWKKIYEALKPPYFIISMVFIFVIVYLLGNWVPESWLLKLEWSPGPWWNQPWRMFTYGLVHSDQTHLAYNAMTALFVGWCLEREQSWFRVAFIWMGGVAAGALGEGAFQPKERMVGASAAVYALLMAHIPNVCFRYGHIPLWWFRLQGVVVVGVFEGCWSLLREPDPQDSNNVAWAAHVLGAAVGIPLGFVAFTGENSSNRCITVLRVSSFLLLAAGIVAATIHYMFYYEPDDYT